MIIGIIENDVVVRIGDHKSLFPNTFFLGSVPTQSFLDDNNAKLVDNTLSANPLTETLEPVLPYVDGDYIRTMRVRSFTEQELEFQKQTKWLKVRAQRNRMLSDSDWTQMPDAPETDKTEWATYRQALRDITTQDDPYNITWPLMPGQEPPPEPVEEPAPAPETTTVVTTESEPEPVPVDPSTVTSTSIES